MWTSDIVRAVVIAGLTTTTSALAQPMAATTAMVVIPGLAIAQCAYSAYAPPYASGIPCGTGRHEHRATYDMAFELNPRPRGPGHDWAPSVRSESSKTAPSAIFRGCIDRAGGATSAMLECGSAEIARVDARLNAAYRRLMAVLPATQTAELRKSQRAWLRHHLSETQRLADAPDNGSLALVDSQRFELQDLGERTILLERMLAGRR